MSKIKFNKVYEAKEVEDRIYKKWLASGFFNPDNLPNQNAPTYTVMIAPPNITGSLHLGHALENTVSDILIRYHRMKGLRTLWLPGTDHAGIATQNVVEKDLQKQGLTRQGLGKEKFLDYVWQWREKYGHIILDQLKQLGCSLDWSRTRFTLDENYQAAVEKAFKHYLAKGLIYQGERLINWCIKDQTSLSDLELEYVAEKGTLWQIKYPIKDSNDFIEVATTRPETMLGDTAVAVNPSDQRYKELVGKKVIVPLVNREVPIIADKLVDKEFGTGAVKVTPAHDLTDSEIGERYGLKFIKVIDEAGRIINVNDQFNSKKIATARKLVVSQLKELKLLVGEKVIRHNVAKCYRCGSTVEPMLSKQWFLKMKPLAKKALAAIEKGEVVYKPDRWKRLAEEWLMNVRDWCISRQIWWGHKIPLAKSQDTFDTWFSSALWPLATLGWPEQTKDLKKFYPTNFITSARDILHLWISRMLFSGLEFMHQVPFKEIHIHATIMTQAGKRMSKSLGTGVDPLRLIEKYGADAVRFGLVYQAFGGQDIRFDESVIMMGRKFCNKLWNIARFVLTKTQGVEQPLDLAAQDLKDKISRELLHQANEITEKISECLVDYNFGQAAHILYDFIWHDFADKYIEYSKTKDSLEIKQVVGFVLAHILKILHPFMPFITEELWALTGHKRLLLIERWPSINL